MALVGIAEAARLAGVSEKTIRRKVASGEISTQMAGQTSRLKKIDTSELLRVFGSLTGQIPVAVSSISPATSTKEVGIHGQNETGMVQVIETQQVLINVLQDQLGARTEENKVLRDQVIGLLEWRKPDPAPQALPAAPRITRRGLVISLVLTVLIVIGAVSAVIFKLTP